MASKGSPRIAKKTARRLLIVEGILVGLTNDKIFTTLDYKNRSEGFLKQYMHQPVLAALRNLHRNLTPGLEDSTYERKAEKSLFWEGDVKKTINNIQFLGVHHRPDFKVVLDSNRTRIAVEVKLGQTGSVLREGIGQSIVYGASGEFDFVIYLFVDTSLEGKIAAAMKCGPAQAFAASIWEKHNVRFEVV